MRRFTYVGNRSEVTCWGVTFPAGEAVAVDPADHPVLVRKLPGNPDFTETFDGVEIVGPASESAVVFVDEVEAEGGAAAAASVSDEPAADAEPASQPAKRRGRPPKVK